MNKANTLETMKSIIQNYLNQDTTRAQAVEHLINKVDIDFILNLDVESEPDNFIITDCYWAIKHLLENCFETSNEELQYFNECLNNRRVYNIIEKNKILQEYYGRNHGD